jgi:hypothetical protein
VRQNLLVGLVFTLLDQIFPHPEMRAIDSADLEKALGLTCRLEPSDVTKGSGVTLNHDSWLSAFSAKILGIHVLG